MSNKIKKHEKEGKRESSIELLRIIMVTGVILLHYNTMGGGYDAVRKGSINQYYLFGVESFFVCAVDVFIMISGYFLCTNKKRNFIKVVELLLQVIVINFMSYAIRCFTGELSLSFRGIIGCFIPVNYYVILYSTLYLLSPYINLLMENLNKNNKQKFLITIFLFFSVYTSLVAYVEKIIGLQLNGLSTVGLYGSSRGYTIVNFVLIYIIGAYARSNIKKVRISKILVILCSLIVGLYIFTIIEYKTASTYGTVWNYDNPMVIMISLCALLFFTQIKMNCKIINELSRAVFTCFLFHGVLLKYFRIEDIVNMKLSYLILHQIAIVIIIYIISYLIYKIYHWISKPVIEKLRPLCSIIDELLLINLD